MKCPLLLISSPGLGRKEDTTASECLEERCAWWLGGDRLCAVTALAGKIYDLDTTLDLIKDKMNIERLV